MKKNRKKRLFRWLILFLVVLFGTGYYAYSKGYFDRFITENKMLNVLVERKNLKTYDLYSKTRPYAVMIDNIKYAWPQTGLSDAFLIYEIIVEGGQTRLMALFKDQDTIKIGPIRSSRHYYLDYAMENDAIYVHFGGSGKAYSDIKSLGINNLDGLANSSGMAYRDTNRPAPHNVYASIANMKKYAEKKNYRLTTDKDPLLNYSFSEVNLEEKSEAKTAVSVKVVYSNLHTTSYNYDATNKLYTRKMNGIDHKDRVTGENYTFKNIIIIKVKNDPLIDNSNKGRQEVYTIGKGNGYFITNGYYIPITWEKSTRSAQTIFKDLAGKEIKVNDGKTFIQIQPISRSTTLE